MGEYINYRNRKIKVGTCENMFYARYSQLKAAYDSGCEEVAAYLTEESKSRYRFPFPDEDKIQMGAHEDFDRGVLLVIERHAAPEKLKTGWQEITGYETAERYNHLRYPYTAANPNNSAPTICFELVQQRLTDGKLIPVFRCPFTGWKFTVLKDDADIIAGNILKAHSADPLYSEMVRRMLAGYNAQ